MCVSRYGLSVNLDVLMADAKGLFYYIYDLKNEDIPSEEEWSVRMGAMEEGELVPKCRGMSNSI